MTDVEQAYRLMRESDALVDGLMQAYLAARRASDKERGARIDYLFQLALRRWNRRVNTWAQFYPPAAVKP